MNGPPPIGANTPGEGIASIRDLRALKAIRRYQLTVIPIGDRGAVRVFERGVDIAADKLSRIDARELKPVRW